MPCFGFLKKLLPIQAGEHLARLDVEKQCAMEKEEYDLAKKKKDEMDGYRRSVYQQLEVHNLFDMAMVSHQTQIVALHSLCVF